MITPKDIETKIFSYSVRGYNKREVDEFLDQIMIDYQSLLDQNAKMSERISSLKRQVADATDPTKMTSGAFSDAKKLMNDISASAEQRAEVIIQNAEKDAANIVSDARTSTTQAGEDVVKLKRKIEKFKTRYKNMLQNEIERVDDDSDDLLAELRRDFYGDGLFDDSDESSITRATGIGALSKEEAETRKADEHEELDLGDFAPESEQKENAVPRVEEITGFRSEHDSKMDDTVVFTMKDTDTMDIEIKTEQDADEEEPESEEAEAEPEVQAEEAEEAEEPEEEAEAEESEEDAEAEEAEEEEAEDEEESEEKDGSEDEEEKDEDPEKEPGTSDDDDDDDDDDDEDDEIEEGSEEEKEESEEEPEEEPEEKESPKPPVPPQTHEERVQEFKETASKLIDDLFSSTKG